MSLQEKLNDLSAAVAVMNMQGAHPSVIHAIECLEEVVFALAYAEIDRRGRESRTNERPCAAGGE